MFTIVQIFDIIYTKCKVKNKLRELKSKKATSVYPLKKAFAFRHFEKFMKFTKLYYYMLLFTQQLCRISCRKNIRRTTGMLYKLSESPICCIT